MSGIVAVKDFSSFFYAALVEKKSQVVRFVLNSLKSFAVDEERWAGFAGRVVPMASFALIGASAFLVTNDVVAWVFFAVVVSVGASFLLS